MCNHQQQQQNNLLYNVDSVWRSMCASVHAKASFLDRDTTQPVANWIFHH